jgi:hypothetical protein
MATGVADGVGLPVRPVSGAGDTPNSWRTQLQKLVLLALVVLIDPVASATDS